MVEIPKKRVKRNLPLKVLSIVVLLSFISDFVFIDYVSARSTVKKTRFDLMEEEPDTRRGGASQPTMNQTAVDTMNALLDIMARPQTLVAPDSNIIFSDPGQNHEMDPRSHAEMLRALNLVKDENATLKIDANTNLSDLIREGKIQDNAKVVVAEGAILTIDIESAVKIEWMRVDGELKFDTHQNTQLNVGTLVVNDMGSLKIGSANDRVQADKMAKLIFADFGSIADDANDPTQLGHGLIVMGQIQVYGAESNANIQPIAALIKGATQVTFSQSASGWRVGDEILLVSTANSQGWDSIDQSEKVKISAISADGRTITFDRALAYDHVMPDGASPPVSRMTRNVEFSSQNQTDVLHQGHIMIMGYAELDGASFVGLGRTTNLIVTDPVFDAQGNFVDTQGRIIVFDPLGNYVDAQGRFIIFDSQGNFVDGAGNVINAQGKLAMLDAQGHYVDPQGNAIVMPNNKTRLDANGNFSDFTDPNNPVVVFFVRRIVENVRGRYAVHFHRTGVDSNSPINLVRNCSLDAGEGSVVSRWGGVNHSSKVNFIDNVFNGFSGTNLMADEKGDAMGLVQGNVTSNSDGALSVADFRLRGGFTYSNALGQLAEDVGHRGHGIYLEGGGGVTVTGNWVFGNHDAGIIYWRLTVLDGGKRTLFPLENVLDKSVLNSLRLINNNGNPDGIITVDGKQYVNIDSVPVYLTGNVIGSSGSMIMLGYNMMGHTKTEEDAQNSVGFSVIKDNIGFGFVGGGILLNYSAYVHIENNIILRQNPNAAPSTFTYGAGVSGNDFTNCVTMINNTVKGFDYGISAVLNGLTIIKGGYLENVTNIGIHAPFHGDLALDVDPATTTRTTIIDNVRFGFYTEKPPYTPKPFSDIYLQGQENVFRVTGYDYAAWDFDRNPVIIRGENLDSLIVRMNYKGAMVSGANPNLYFYSDFVSNNFANNLNGYIAVMKGMYANLWPKAIYTAAPVNLQEGLNIFNMNVDGKSQQVIVFGDTHGPNFVPDPSVKLEINASDLAKGFNLLGRSIDRSGNIQFENLITKHFDNLVPNADGIVKLEFDIKDRAGNLSHVSLDLKVIQDVTVIPPVIQALAEAMKTQIGEGRTVTVVADVNHPGKYIFTIRTQGASKAGHLQILRFSTDDKANVDKSSLLIFFRQLSGIMTRVQDPGMLWDGLSRIAGQNSFAAIKDMVLQSQSAQDKSIQFELNTNYWKLSKDSAGQIVTTRLLPPAVQAFVDALKTKMGDAVVAAFPYIGTTNMVYIYNTKSVLPGHLRIFRFQVDNQGQILTDGIMFGAFNKIDGAGVIRVDAKLLYAGLSQMAGVDPFVVMKDMVLQSSDDRGIRLDLGNDSWKIYRDSAGKVHLEKQTLSWAIQALLEKLKIQIGANYSVQAQPDWSRPGGYLFFINASNGVAPGHLQLLMFSADQKGKITDFLGTVFKKFDGSMTLIDGQMLYTGLSQLPEIDPIRAMAEMTLQSSDAQGIQFALGTNIWRVYRDKQGAVQIGPVMVIDPLPDNWIQVQVADSITQNQEISVQYKLTQPATNGSHVHCSISAQPVTPQTVKNISFDNVVMSFPGSDGQTGNASLSTKGIGTGDYYISFWGVTKDHEYDGNGIVTRKITINPAAAAPMMSVDSSAGISGGRRKAVEPVASRGKKRNRFNFDDAMEASESNAIQEV